jgi:tetratricopeptide (TPR) repeat protein
MPGLDRGPELAIRRDSIAERFFKPAGRLEKYAGASAPRSGMAVENYLRLIEETRSHAPDDFPYASVVPLSSGPAAAMRTAVALQQKGQTAEAEALLRDAAARYPAFACEINTNLAVINYTTGRREAAQSLLEEASAKAGPSSPPDCLRSLYLLGSVYDESGQKDAAAAAFQRFLAASAGSADPQIVQFRRGLQKR